MSAWADGKFLTCPVCRQARYAYVPGDQQGRYLRPRFYVLMRHDREDTPVLGFIKRLWPWYSKPICEGSGRTVDVLAVGE